MKTTLRGVEFDVTKEEIIRAAAFSRKGRGRTYVVKIEGQYYPPKDVVYKLLETKFEEFEDIHFSRMDFTTMDAARILRRLGFSIVEADRVEWTEKRLTNLSGVLSLGGDSIKDSESYYE